MGGRPHRKDREDSLLDHDGLDGDTDSGGGGGSGGGVTALGLVSVGFFWVSGGLYGNEPLIASAPPGILMLALLVMMAPVPFTMGCDIAHIADTLKS